MRDATSPLGDRPPVPPCFLPRRRLGEGGTSEVFEAVWRPSGRRVALKMGRSGLTEPLRQGMRREARLGRELRHPGFLSVLASGNWFGRPWLAQELGDGESLAALRPCRSFTAERRLSVFSRVARHLEHLHAHGYIHRDIKADNVMLTRRGPVLIDLGLAARPDEIDEAQRWTCTPSTVAPEQVLGDPVDRRADVFQLGVLLYELFARRRPWGDRADDSAARTLKLIVHEPPISLRANLRPELGLPEDVADGVDRLAQACLRKRPDDRPMSALRVARYVEGLLAGTKERAPRPATNPAALAA